MFGLRHSFQNLTREDARKSIDGSRPRRFPMNARGWIYAPWARSCIFKYEWSLKFTFANLEFGIDDEDGYIFTIAIPPVFLHVAINPRGKYHKKRRTINFSFSEGSFRWSIWRDWTDGWSREIPFWRDGYFDIRNFFLGASKYESREIEKRDVVIPMPEKNYKATATLEECSWSRPRWFTHRSLFVKIDVPEGIPREGKGENSWDCGIDRTYGISTRERTIPEGVGSLVGSMLKDRVRYGGWSDWNWPKEKIDLEKRQDEALRKSGNLISSGPSIEKNV